MTKTQNGDVVAFFNRVRNGEIALIDIYRNFTGYIIKFPELDPIESIVNQHRLMVDVLKDKIEVKLGNLEETEATDIILHDGFQFPIDPEEVYEVLRNAELVELKECSKYLVTHFLDPEDERFIQEDIFNQKWEILDTLDRSVLRLHAA